MDHGSKLKEKLDKKELEEIQSKILTLEMLYISVAE